MADIKLAGRWYDIAEDAEGAGYNIRREPLRLPNSQVVKGAEQFQLRPDLIQWSITSWVGGEGQIKLDSKDTTRSYLIVNTDPFSSPGNLVLGPTTDIATYSAANLAEKVTFTSALGNTYAARVYGAQQQELWKFDPVSFTFDATYVSTMYGGTTPAGVAGDANYLFYIQSASDSIHRWDGTTFVHLNNQTSVTSVYANVVSLGDYLYIYDPEQGMVYEISKVTANTATAEVPIYDFSSAGGSTIVNNGLGYMIAGDNRLYVLQNVGHEAVIHEIVPTSAAATGYGREMSRMPGIVGHGLAWMSGFIVLLAKTKGRTGDRFEAFYLQPDAALGTFGEIRSHLGSGPLGSLLSPGVANLRYLSFVGPSMDSATLGPSLFLLDAVTGGFAQIADGLVTAGSITGKLASVDGIWLVPVHSDDRIYYTRPDKYRATGYAITPYYDFDLSDEKVLHNITITCEPLPAATTVEIQYDLGDGTFTSAGILPTDDSEGITYTISTDTTTKTFRTLRIKVILNTTNASNTPVVRSVEVRASVVKYIKTWELLLDLSDDDNTGAGGASNIDALLALSENTVYALEDYYNSHSPGEHTAYDVEMDSLTVSLSQPGEGVAQIVLREV
jgi:hypothetical protein